MNMHANKKTTLRSVVRPLITAMSKRLATRWSAVSLAMMASLGFHDDEPEVEPRPSVSTNEEAGDADDAADNVADAGCTLDFAALAAIMPAPSAVLTRAWMTHQPLFTLSSGRRLEAIDETASMAVDDAEDARMLARCVTQRAHFGVECFEIDDEEDDDELEADDEQEAHEHESEQAQSDVHETRAAADDDDGALQAAAEDGTTLERLRSDIAPEDDHAPATLAPVTTVAATDRAPLGRSVDVQDEQVDIPEDSVGGLEPVLPSDDDSAIPMALLQDDEHASEDTSTAADAVTYADVAHAPLHQQQTTSDGTGAAAAVAVDGDDDVVESPSTSPPPRPLSQPAGSSSSRSTASLSSSRSPSSPSPSALSVVAEARTTRPRKVSPYAHVPAKVQSHNHTSVPPPPHDYATKEAVAKKLQRLQNRELRHRLATVGPRVGSFNYGPPAHKPTPTEFEQTLAFELLEVRVENHVMRRRLSHVVATVRTQATSSEASRSPSASSFPSDIVPSASLPASTSTSTSPRTAQRLLEQATVRQANAATRQRRSLVQAVVQSHNHGPRAVRPSSRSSTSTRTTARSTPSLQDPAIKAANAAQRERLRCVRPVTNSHNATATR